MGGEVNAGILARMTDSLTHRGPDGCGTWVDEQRRIGLGHRRLSILDLTSAGAQPMAGAAGRTQIVFNGEIYNHLELRTKLKGYPFRSNSDTEVILAAYERWGDSCVDHFNGMFAFALWDKSTGKLLCARDRLGVKPFYYTWHNGGLMFASEIKALLAGGIKPQPEMAAWTAYVVHGSYEPQDGSFFKGVRSLPPGHLLTAQPGHQPTLRRYWYLPDRTQDCSSISEEEAADELSGHLDRAVDLRMRSDVPVGLNLTGGLDSSAVASSFFKHAKRDQPIHVFTAAFDEPQYDEDGYADQVIGESYCTRHRVRLAAQDVPALSMRAMWYQEAPFGGIGTLAYHHLHETIAQQGIKVVLEGQGGDELFGGYAYFAPAYLLDLLDAKDCAGIRRLLKPAINPRRITALARSIKSGNSALYQDGTSFLSPDCVAKAVMATSSPAPTYPEPFSDRFTNAMYRDLTYIKLQRVLRMNDRLAMASGVELRQPFLDCQLVEFAFSLPPRLRIAQGYSKYILRRAMDGRLPKTVVWEPKRPVVTPQREWVAGPLREWVEDTINSSSFAGRGLFDVKQVKAEFKRYLSGNMENSFAIWQWLNAELWFHCFVDQKHGDTLV